MHTFCGHFLWTSSSFVAFFSSSFLAPCQIFFGLFKEETKFRRKKYAFCLFLSVLVKVLLSASIERFNVSCMQDFLFVMIMVLALGVNRLVP